MLEPPFLQLTPRLKSSNDPEILLSPKDHLLFEFLIKNFKFVTHRPHYFYFLIKNNKIVLKMIIFHRFPFKFVQKTNKHFFKILSPPKPPFYVDIIC